MSFNFLQQKGKIAVWVVNKNSGLNPKEYLHILSEAEKNKAKAFFFNSDYLNFVFSRGILRKLIGYYLNMDPKEVQFRYGTFGKPELVKPALLNFNISHSGDIILLGFSKNHSLGVDVEKIKSNFDVLDIAGNYFSSKEIKTLSSLPTSIQNLAFYRCWTRKESFIKAKGSGLSFPLDSFTVSLDTDNTAKLLETQWDPKEKLEWNMFSFVPAPEYIAAVSVHGNIKEIKLINWDATI